MAGGRVLRIDWREVDTAAALGDAYRRERDPEVRPRLQAVWLLRQGRSLPDTTAVVGVHYRTVQTWLAWYRAGGLGELRAHHQAGIGRAAYLTAEQQERLVAEVATGRFFTAGEVRQWVADTFGVDYRPKGIYPLLARLGCHPKVPRPYNPRSTPEEQAAWKKGGLPPPSPPPG
jgi:transposase